MFSLLLFCQSEGPVVAGKQRKKQVKHLVRAIREALYSYFKK